MPFSFKYSYFSLWRLMFKLVCMPMTGEKKKKGGPGASYCWRKSSPSCFSHISSTPKSTEANVERDGNRHEFHLSRASVLSGTLRSSLGEEECVLRNFSNSEDPPLKPAYPSHSSPTYCGSFMPSLFLNFL